MGLFRSECPQVLKHTHVFLNSFYTQMWSKLQSSIMQKKQAVALALSLVWVVYRVISLHIYDKFSTSFRCSLDCHQTEHLRISDLSGCNFNGLWVSQFTPSPGSVSVFRCGWIGFFGEACKTCGKETILFWRWIFPSELYQNYTRWCFSRPICKNYGHSNKNLRLNKNLWNLWTHHVL